MANIIPQNIYLTPQGGLSQECLGNIIEHLSLSKLTSEEGNNNKLSEFYEFIF